MKESIRSNADTLPALLGAGMAIRLRAVSLTTSLAWLLPSGACPGLAVRALHLPLAGSERRHFLGKDETDSQVPERVHVIDVTRKFEK